MESEADVELPKKSMFNLKNNNLTSSYYYKIIVMNLFLKLGSLLYFVPIFF